MLVIDTPQIGDNQSNYPPLDDKDGINCEFR